MMTREKVIHHIRNIPATYLEELYKLIVEFEAEKQVVVNALPSELQPDQAESQLSFMSKLRAIKIYAPENFSEVADLYMIDDEDE